MVLISHWLSYPRESQGFAPYKSFQLCGIYLILLYPSTQINFFFLHACTLILAARPPISSRCYFWECAGRSLILNFLYYQSFKFLPVLLRFFPSFCILLISPFFSFLPSLSSSLPFLMMLLTLILLSLV